MVTEQFSISIVTVVAQVYTGDKMSQGYSRTYQKKAHAKFGEIQGRALVQLIVSYQCQHPGLDNVV